MEVGHTEGSVYLDTLDTVFVRNFWGRHIGCGCPCLIHVGGVMQLICRAYIERE